MDKCFICGSKKKVSKHHVVPDWHDNKHGKIRKLGDELWTVPLCEECHNRIHREFWQSLPNWKEKANERWLELIREKAIRLIFDRGGIE